MADRSHMKGAMGGPRVIWRVIAIGALFKDAASQWLEDNCLRMSAAVSFYAVLSLAPLLAIVIRVMGVAHAKHFARERILALTTSLMGTQAANAIKPIIDSGDTHGPATLGTAISTVVLLFSTTGVFIELKDSMNCLWGVRAKAPQTKRAQHVVREFIRTRLLSLAMVFALGFGLVGSMFISGLFTAFEEHLNDGGWWPGYLAQFAVSSGVGFVLFAAIFKFLPDVNHRWRDVWHGALIAAVLFSVGRFGLAIYFKYSRIDNMYGAAGSLVAVLIWIYYSSFSLFYGAEFTKVWARRAPVARRKQ
ncbi:MAG: YihY/virulence factor BrkB family protein [Tepidisphaeraceae bacterium]|jgi:membrane protein